MNIINPLIINKCVNINSNEIIYIYFLIKKNSQIINDEFFHYEVDKDLYNKICKNLLLYKIKYNNNLKNQLYNGLLVSKTDLEIFNIFNYELEDKNIVIPFLNINYENFIDYIIQFNSNEIYNILKLININKYLKLSNDNIEHIIKKLNNTDIKFWTKKYSDLDFSLIFKNRQFVFLKSKNNNKVDYTINNVESKYIDISLVLNSTNYLESDNNLNIYEILINLEKKSQFLLFTNLLVSKRYSNLVINNIKILKLMEPIIKNHYNIFRYLLGYTWLSLYFDECNAKEITINNNFIFDINTANLLPVFPIVSNPKLNPYFTLLVNDKILNPQSNFISIIDYDNYDNKGICNLEEFKLRLNLFCTEKEYNLFENINFNDLKLAICGSIMAACIQKHHPLLEIFNVNNFKDKFIKYKNEFYSKSDIDIMFMSDNYEMYINNVNKFYDQINKNIENNFNNNKSENHTKLIPNLIVHVYISKNCLDSLNITLNQFNNQKTNIDFIKSFEPIYGNLIEDELNKLKIPLEYNKYINIKLYLNNYNLESIALNFKYKIESIYLKHSLELFNIKNGTFISKVSKFHLPCVRSYYDSNNVYMTPSCITAHLTYMNIDYKYVYSTTSPQEIIYKYRLRGFGTWLSEKEKNVMRKYISSSELINYYTSRTIFGVKTIYDHIYKFNNENIYIKIPNNIKTNKLLYHEQLTKKFNTYKSIYSNLINCDNLQTISKDGTIIPLNSWLIDVLEYYF